MSVDNKLLETLYIKHGTSVRRYTEKRLEGRLASHVEDVVHDTFLRAARHLSDKNKKVASPRQYLLTVARNLVTALCYRDRQNTETDAKPSMDYFAANADAFSPERSAFGAQELERVWEGIAALPKNQREVLIRLRVLGESRSEIAGKLGIGKGTVSTYVVRAWRTLEEYCDEYDIALDDLFGHE